MSWQKFRERVNISLYDSKASVLKVLKGLNLFVSVSAILALIYYYGFPQDDVSEYFVFSIIKTSFTYYILQFLVHLFYDFKPTEFLKKNWFEGLIMLLLLVEGISYNFQGELLLPRLFTELGIKNFPHFSAIFIQVYFLIAVITELARSGTLLPNIRIHPSNLFISSFLVIISLGTGLLMLPEMTNIKGSMNLLDALFTSTSATCVTGLIVQDTATFFTFKGQMVIMLLIKLGGLNIITFGTFVAFAGRLGVSIKQHEVIEDFVNTRSILSSDNMFGNVITWSIIIELIGSFLIFLFWSVNVPFETTGDRYFHSIFQSISAFNNAGFSTFTNGLNNPLLKSNYSIHIIIGILIFVGALGFMALFDLFSIKNLRNRLRYPWKQIEFPTKIALFFSIGLVLFGAVAFFILEYNNSLNDRNFLGSTITALFQSVTARTAGFNTIDIGSIGIPMLIIFILLMFIGASSSSTGGGIKTSTFGVLWASTIATIRSQKNVELFKRTVSQVLVLRAFTIFMFFIFGIFLGTLLLSITESHLLASSEFNFTDILFEEVSAFATVGLTTGVTQELSWMGKIIIIVSMFVGRVGTLTIGFAIGRTAISTNYKYPKGHTMIG